MRRDAIVIGSGVGGMTAALLLALEGRGVTLVERQTRLAPLVRGFQREGLRCDAGLHYLGGLNDGGGFQALFRRLGLLDRIRTTPMSPDAVDILSTRDDPPVRMAQGPERARQSLHERFPDDRAAIDAYIDRVVSIYAQAPFTNLDIDPESYYPSDETLADFFSASGAGHEFSRSIEQRGFMLSGLTAKESSLHFHALIVGSYLHAAHTLEGGGPALADAFESRLEELDVHRLLGHAAHAIRTDDRRTVRGVEVRRPDGQIELIESDICVWAAHPRELLPMLSPGVVRRGRRRRIENAPETFAPFLLYLDAPEPPGIVRRSNYYAFPSGTPDRETLAVMACDPSATSGRHALCVLRESWDNIPERGHCSRHGSPICQTASEEKCEAFDRNAYNAYKEKMTNETLDSLFRLFPELRGKCQPIGATTPCALERSTGNRSMYGLKHLAGLHGPGHLGLARGLYLAGQSVGMPGVLGAMTSGFLAVSNVVGPKTIWENLRQCR